MAGEPRGVVLAVHGGAGRYESYPAERLARARDAVAASLEAGLAALAGPAAAVDAVVAAVKVLEDDEGFNAGRGSVLNADGHVEMDAAVADGASGRVGAVGAVAGVRNPVELARAVLGEGSCVLVAGAAGADLARRLGLPMERPGYFVTERRGPHSPGTVGAVARDALGNVAAATSTGGRPRKAPGRIGDSPVPGAGTWADNATCAISATGDGEAFLLAVFAHEVDARLRLLGAPLDDACRAALAAVQRRGGTGGCIALTADGRLAAPFTTPAMVLGWAGENGSLEMPSPFA
jgi:L-asparaginase / beta-aspartyl-peptidase